MFELELYGVAIIPLIIGIVQLLKTAGLNSKYAGLVALAIGLVIALAYGLTEAGWTVIKSVIIGSALGLSASGAYSTQRSIRQVRAKVQ